MIDGDAGGGGRLAGPEKSFTAICGTL